MSTPTETGGNSHPDPGHALSKKLGPLPVGAWIIVVVVSLGLAYYVRSRQAAAPATTDDTTAADTTTGTGDSGTNDAYETDPGAVTDTSDGSTTSTTTTYATDSDWETAAVTYLVGRLYDPVSANNAIGDYMNGVALTTVERAIVNEAILGVGAPPVAPPPPPTADAPPVTVTPPTTPTQPVGPTTPVIPVTPPKTGTPVKAPTPAPAKTKTVIETYTVKDGDTLGEIASHLNISMTTLRAYNPSYWTVSKYDNGNHIWAGDKVKYPVTEAA